VGHVISVLLVPDLIFPIEKQVFPFLEGMHSTEWDEAFPILLLFWSKFKSRWVFISF
jgi:hypothetical protein